MSLSAYITRRRVLSRDNTAYAVKSGGGMEDFMIKEKFNITPLNLFTAVVYMFCIISLSVTFALNFRPLYYFDIDYLKISETSGYPTEEIRANYDALIDYNSAFNHNELKFPTLSMSEGGRIHFVEVKRIFVFIQYLAVVTLFLAVGLTVLQRKRRDFGFLKPAAFLTAVLPLILGVLIALNWDAFFVTFHHLFFNNDYWLFNPATDPVITILPDTFFLHEAILILVCVLGGSLLCFLAGHLRSAAPFECPGSKKQGAVGK